MFLMESAPFFSRVCGLPFFGEAGACHPGPSRFGPALPHLAHPPGTRKGIM